MLVADFIALAETKAILASIYISTMADLKPGTWSDQALLNSIGQ